MEEDNDDVVEAGGHMEAPGHTEAPGVVVQVTVVGANDGVIVFAFRKESDADASFGTVNSYRLFINGRRLKPSERKTSSKLEAAIQSYIPDRRLTAVVVAAKDQSLYTTFDGCQVRPAFFSWCAWTGDPAPPMSDWTKAATAKPPQSADLPRESAFNEQAHVVGVSGTLVHHNMTGMGFISFVHEGHNAIAQFSSKVLFVNGSKVAASEFLQWPRNKTTEVHFDATRHKGLPEVTVLTHGGNEVEQILLPEWKCSRVWIGSEPPGNAKCNFKKDSSSWTEVAEYFSGRLTQFVDGKQAIITAKERAVLFKIQDLVLDGQPVPAEEKLSSLLQIGDILFSYIRPLVPARVIGSVVCRHMAVQIWKGKRTSKTAHNREAVAMDSDMAAARELFNKGAKASPIPLPSQATLVAQAATVIDVRGSLAQVRLNQTGETALVLRNRTFVGGTKLRMRDPLYMFLSVGDAIFADIIAADESESLGKYQWLALLAWKGIRPTSNNIDEDVTNGGVYRAKVIQLDRAQDDSGVSSGLVQIVSGPNEHHVGQRAVFSRDTLHVFGVHCQRADLAYFITNSERISADQLDEIHDQSELAALERRYGTAIRFRISFSWIGPPPKLDPDDRPGQLVGTFLPYLMKRGVDEDIFMSLVRGEMPAKEPPASLINPVAAVASSVPCAVDVPLELDALPPGTTAGRVIELRKPDVASSGTSHGVLLVETGPLAGAKAFFNRSCLTIFGHCMWKADLMYVVKESDHFCVELQGGTDNATVQYKVVSAWVGPRPTDRSKAADVATPTNPAFVTWLKAHNLDVGGFRDLVNGALPPRQFFPLPLEMQNARITHLFPHKDACLGGGCEFGILHISQGSLEKRDVLFERDAVYLWNVHVAKGDLSYLFNKNEKVFCEVTDIIGNDRKKWQMRLQNTQRLPRYQATLVYVGGGRPKPITEATVHKEPEKNANLRDWLCKRGIDLGQFWQIVEGKVMPKQIYSRFSNPPSQAADPPPPHQSAAEALPFRRSQYSLPPPVPIRVAAAARPPPPRFSGREPSPPPASQWPAHNRSVTGAAVDKSMSRSASPPERAIDMMVASRLENPVMKQARALLSRVMGCTSIEDPNVGNVVVDESDAQLAIFMSKTLESAVRAFRTRQQTPPGPIERPVRRADFSVPSADATASTLSVGGSGLYGLEKPLITFASTTPTYTTSPRPPLRRESPSEFVQATAALEPPYKRRQQNVMDQSRQQWHHPQQNSYFM